MDNWWVQLFLKLKANWKLKLFAVLLSLLLWAYLRPFFLNEQVDDAVRRVERRR